jgi:hypothetical protein
MGPQIGQRTELRRVCVMTAVDNQVKLSGVVLIHNQIVVLIHNNVVVVVVIYNQVVVVVIYNQVVVVGKLGHECGHIHGLRRVTQIRLDARFRVNESMRLRVDSHNASQREKVAPSAQRGSADISRHALDAHFQEGHGPMLKALEQDVVQRAVPVAILVGPVMIEQVGEIGRCHGGYEST